MNRDNIIQEILKNIPKNIIADNGLETLKLRSRYLYLELCKRCHYSIEYNLANPENKNEIFNKDLNNINEEESICNEFSLMGVELFKRAGIEAIAMDVNGDEYKGQYMDNPVHVYFMFSFGERDSNGNRKFYLADPSFDLKRVQVRLPNQIFCYSSNYYKK